MHLLVFHIKGLIQVGAGYLVFTGLAALAAITHCAALRFISPPQMNHTFPRNGTTNRFVPENSPQTSLFLQFRGYRIGNYPNEIKLLGCVHGCRDISFRLISGTLIKLSVSSYANEMR